MGNQKLNQKQYFIESLSFRTSSHPWCSIRRFDRCIVAAERRRLEGDVFNDRFFPLGTAELMPVSPYPSAASKGREAINEGNEPTVSSGGDVST